MKIRLTYTVEWTRSYTRETQHTKLYRDVITTTRPQVGEFVELPNDDNVWVAKVTNASFATTPKSDTQIELYVHTGPFCGLSESFAMKEIGERLKRGWILDSD